MGREGPTAFRVVRSRARSRSRSMPTPSTIAPGSPSSCCRTLSSTADVCGLRTALQSARAQISAAAEPTDAARASERLLLTVVVPVYNGGEEIVDNVDVIRRALAERAPGEDVEVIVVSDGSIDETAEQLLEARATRLPRHPLRPQSRQGLRGQGRRARCARRLGRAGRRRPRPRPCRRCRPTSRSRGARSSTSRSARSGIRTRSCTIRARAASRAGATSS